MSGDLISSKEVVCQLLEEAIQRFANGGRTKSFEPLEFKNYLLISHKLMCNIVCDY